MIYYLGSAPVISFMVLKSCWTKVIELDSLSAYFIAAADDDVLLHQQSFCAIIELVKYSQLYILIFTVFF